MDKSNKALRRAEIFEALDKCKIKDTRESILVDKVISLEDSLRELQESYAELIFFVEDVYKSHFNS